jgi:hypothetical protein
MTTIKNIFYLILRKVVIAIFAVKCLIRFNFWWSKLVSATWEQNRDPFKQFTSVDEFVLYIKKLKWRPDTWKQLWDATSNPNHVQWLANNNPSHLIGDCDDFAIYEANIWKQQLLHRKAPWDVVDAEMLSIMWWSPVKLFDGETVFGFSGHNVCLLKHVDGKFSYMDYGYPSQKLNSIQDVVNLVRQTHAPSSLGCGWARNSIELQILQFSWD